MATFHVGEKTHPSVLPQQMALEFESADTPRIRDETGLGHRSAVTGVEHVRGETADEDHPVVFVLDKDGHPLQPTSPSRARKLLKKGRAVVARHTPFVIRLKDRKLSASQVDGLEIGLDPGSKRTGIAVFATRNGERRGVCSVELSHRGGAIRDKLSARAAYRRGRRTRNLRYRAPRFSNRARSKGWLAPSPHHRVERVAFDTHAMSNGGPLEGAEYQHGTLYGTEIREYLLAKWGRACAYCGATGVPLNIDHIHPRSRGGSNRISNLCTACVSCNEKKSNRPVEDFLRRSPGQLAIVLAQARTPLRDATAVNTTRWALWRALAAAVLAVTATGRGTYARTRTDQYGFPRLRLPRQKQFFGYQTGDLARAVVPTGKKAGTHTGRIAVRSTGRFNIKTAHGLIQGIGHQHFRLIQRADGYAYITRPEGPTTAA